VSGVRWPAAGLVTLALVAACGGSGHPRAAPASAPRITGRLATSGDRIVDDAGATVRLLGVDEPGLISGAGNDRATHPDACGEGWRLPAPTEYRDVARAGFNSVRLGLSWANLEPAPPHTGPAGNIVHRWNRRYLGALDRAVAGFTGAGVAVILDMHQNHMSPAFKWPVPDRCQGAGLPTWVYPDASIGANQAECDFFADRSQASVPVGVQAGYTAALIKVVRRYAANPLVVGADLFNEPSAGTCPGLDVAPFYRRLGARLRRIDPHLLLICQAGGGPDGETALPGPVGVPGWVYSFHFYLRPGQPVGPALGAFFRPAARWHVPVWVGEFGVYHRGPAAAAVPPEMSGEIRAAVAALRRHGAGWAFHQYAGGSGALTSRASEKVLHPDWLAALRSGY
jgi:Cellulase (glycosyl hydrolase family 5)